MSAHEFLNLLRMVEGGRKCEGKECLEITNEHMARAVSIESNKTAHAPSVPHEAGASPNCAVCENIRQQEIALREQLHAEGIDFPVGMLNSQPEP